MAVFGNDLSNRLTACVRHNHYFATAILKCRDIQRLVSHNGLQSPILVLQLFQAPRP